MAGNNDSREVMRALFAPAIVLLDRLNYTKKFTLLWLVSLLAIAVVVYSLLVNLDRVIQPSQLQLEGIALIKPASRTVQAIQLHRGISAALLSGNEALRDRRAATEREAAGLLDALERQLPAGLASGETFRNIKADWARLRKEGLDWTVAENFAAHVRLIEQIHSIELVIADEYALILDPEAGTYYLIDTAINKLPHALEHLGQLRAYGAGILAAGKQVSGQQKDELNRLIIELDVTLRELGANTAKTVKYNPPLQDSFAAASGRIIDSAQHLTDLVTSDILSGRSTLSPGAFLDIATTDIENGYAQLHETLLPATETLIEARIARAKQDLFTSVGLSSLIFMLAVYMSVSFYYAIIGNVQSLLHSFRTFAKGDLGVRVKLRTRDELAQIADGFNEMADGFNAMLEARKHAEESLAKESRKNEMLLRAASDGIHILDLDGNVVQVNEAFCRMLGYTEAELLGMNVSQWDAQRPAEQIKAGIAALGDSPITLETRHRRRDGSIIDVEVSTIKVDIDGLPLVYCSSRDITERKQTERALAENQEKLHTIIETALDAVVQMDAEGIITGWNDQAEKVFGWTREQAVGRSLHETIIPPQFRDAHVNGLKHFLASGEGDILNSRVEMLGLHRDGRELPIELSITAINTAGKYEFNGFIRDITGRKASEELIWKQANYDTLTSLPNRRMFHDRLAQEIKKAHRAGLKMALLFIDLDKFKEVNDTLGHSVGDLLLQEAARRIGDCVRETDTVARLGGDEFTIILAEMDNTESIERIAESLRQSLAEPFRLGEETAYISASIGITLYPDDAAAVEELLKNADQAMYAAKQAGRNRFSYFTQSMQQIAQARLRLTNELRGALAAGQFRVHYQPIVELATGRINKAEALLRWQHPERGLISPAEFIPLAEESGLIVGIGNWVFREAAQQARRLRALYNPDFQISVNVSPVQFCNTADCTGKGWFSYLQELKLPGQCTAIEITEGLLLDADSDVARKLLEFRDAGIQTAIDDFGTGYSSLAYLKKFDIDYLKIDQSFVRDLVADPNDMALSEAIIVMAHKLGLKVIAEGVETEAQRALLAQAGCDYAQGYLFSRPLPADEFEKLLERQRPRGHHFQI